MLKGGADVHKPGTEYKRQAAISLISADRVLIRRQSCIWLTEHDQSASSTWVDLWCGEPISSSRAAKLRCALSDDDKLSVKVCCFEAGPLAVSRTPCREPDPLPRVGAHS